MGKLSSRKFWLAVGGSAAGVASIVSGLVIPDESATLALTIVGAVLMAVSVVAYNFAEAYVDGQNAKSTMTVNQNTINSSTELKATTANTSVADKLIPVVSAEDTKIGGIA